MNLRSRNIRLTAMLLAAWTLLGAVIQAEVTVRLSSRFLARGERALLEVAHIGKRPTAFPEIAPIEGVKITSTQTGPRTQLIPGRKVEHIFSYIVSSYEVGDHRIEPIQLKVDNETFMTDPLDFSVFNPDDLTWSEARAGDTEFRYASAFKVLNDQRAVTVAQPLNEGQKDFRMFTFADLYFLWEFYSVAVDELIVTTIAGVVSVTVVAFLLMPHW